MIGVPPPLADADRLLLQAARGSDAGVARCVAERLGVGEREGAAWLASRFGWPFLETRDLQAMQPALDVLPLARAQQRRAVVMRAAPDAEGGWCFLAVLSDPFDDTLQSQLAEAAHAPIRFALASGDDIHAYLSQLEAASAAMSSLDEGAADDGEAGRAIEVLSLATMADEQSPAVRLLNSTLYDALRAGASDVHLEAVAGGLVVRFRVDGVLDTVAQPAGRQLCEQTISRLKVLAELDIGERRVPQDGSFRVQAQDRTIDLRVSVMPSVHGEDAVIRILDKRSVIEAHGRLTLDALGFDVGSLRTLRGLIDAPYGMLLVTGPTGSGKTTTLYAALAETHTGRDKIVTIEDPVEYQLPGVLQIPVNEKKGLSFARGLRSILRHDPDKIMVGEIRDPETAQIAINSALTGHLVFTTVHANNVLDVLGRFLNMGVEAYQFVSALNCVLAQRLVRNICPHCKRPAKVNRFMLEESGMDPALEHSHTFYEGKGCIECGGTGYKGRHAICELLDLSDRIREMILARRPTSEIKKAARDEGMRFLRECAVERVLQGVTTLREINKVTFVE